MKRLPTCLLALLPICPAVGAQSLALEPCGGSIGGTVRYELSGGKARTGFLVITSLRRSFLPLSVVDPNDKRSLRVGLELPQLNVAGALDAQGQVSFSLPLPNDSALAGLALLHQAFTYPGQGRVFDGVSDVSVVPMDRGGAFRQQATQLGSARAFHTLLPLGDGRHLVVGGGKGSLFFPQAWATTEVFDEADRQFAAGPALSVERASHTQSPLPDGRYLLTGGVDKANAAHSSTEIWDPVSGKFTPGPAMSARRMSHTATVLSDGRVFVAGGIADMSSTTAAVTSAVRSTQLFDPKTNTWSPGPNMSIARAGHVAIPIGNDRVLLAGGITWRSFFFIKIPSISNRCEVYDHNTRRISRVGSLRTSRALFAAARLPDGKVIVAGGLAGSITSGGNTVATCELFDPQAGSWTATASLANDRAMPNGLLLDDGRFAVLGGGSGNLYGPLPIKSCEAFDHKTGKWSALPDLTTPRLTAAAVLSRACGVNVVGGGTGAKADTVTTHELLVR